MVEVYLECGRSERWLLSLYYSLDQAQLLIDSLVGEDRQRAVDKLAAVRQVLKDKKLPAGKEVKDG